MTTRSLKSLMFTLLAIVMGAGLLQPVAAKDKNKEKVPTGPDAGDESIIHDRLAGLGYI